MYNRILIIKGFNDTYKFSIVDTISCYEKSYQVFYKHMDNIKHFITNFINVFGPIDKTVCIGDDELVFLDEQTNTYVYENEIKHVSVYNQNKLKDCYKLIMTCKQLSKTNNEMWNNIKHICYNYEHTAYLISNRFNTSLHNSVLKIYNKLQGDDKFHQITKEICQKLTLQNGEKETQETHNIYNLFIDALWKKNINTMIIFSYPKTKLYIKTNKFNSDIPGLCKECRDFEKNKECTYKLSYNPGLEMTHTLPLDKINIWLSSYYLRDLHIWYKDNMFYSSKYIFVPFQDCYQSLLIAYIISEFYIFAKTIKDIQIPISNIYVTGKFAKYKSILQLISDITFRPCIILDVDKTMHNILLNKDVMNEKIIQPNKKIHKQIHMYINNFSPFLTTNQPHITPQLVSNYVYNMV